MCQTWRAHAVDPRPQGFREIAVVRAYSGSDHPAVSDRIVFGEQADGVLRHLDTLLRRGAEDPVGQLAGKRGGFIRGGRTG